MTKMDEKTTKAYEQLMLNPDHNAAIVTGVALQRATKIVERDYPDAEGHERIMRINRQAKTELRSINLVAKDLLRSWRDGNRTVVNDILLDMQEQLAALKQPAPTLAEKSATIRAQLAS